MAVSFLGESCFLRSGLRDGVFSFLTGSSEQTITGYIKVYRNSINAEVRHQIN